MTDLSRDPIANVIQQGIKRDIDVAIANECYRAATILMLAAMDAMAYLGIPEGQEEVGKHDFIAWAERYVHFPGTEQLTGADLYGARCAMLHAYGAKSRLSRAGKCRLIGWVDRLDPPVKYSPSVSEDVVMVSLTGLRDALFAGIDQCLIDIYSNPQKAKVADKRFQGLVHVLEAPPVGDYLT